MPDGRENAVPFVNKAMESCRGKNSVVVVFEKGRYDFWPHHCTEKNYYESNTTVINLRRCAIMIEKLKNITIECNGSEFIFHDRMQPFTIDSSSNVTIKNVSVDWDIPFGAEAEIVDVTPAYFDLSIDAKQFPYVVENEKLYFIGEGWKSLWGGVKWNDPMEFDRETLEVTQETNDDLLGENWENKYTAKELGEGLVRILYDSNRLLKKGNYLVLRHSVRDHSGVFIVDSKDVVIENMKMYSNAGLSFLAQFSENIAYRNVHCIPNPAKRKILSGHDDGFHYSNCRGQLTVENCSFKGLMDDAINVHGTCVKIIEKVNDKTLVCKFMHNQSIGMIWARAGESVGLINHENMNTVATARVESFEMRSPEFFEITFAEPIPQSIVDGDALENLTWTPNVTITQSYFGSHRARGILISTPGKVLIEQNVFESSGSAIVIPGDANHWFETGSVKSVTISNNVFKGSCLTSLYQFCEAIVSIYPEIPKLDVTITPYHRNIRITKNIFETFDYPVLFALNVDEIKFNDNIIKRVETHKAFHSRKHTLTFDACRNIEVKGNRFEGDVLGKNIELLRTDAKEMILGSGQEFTIDK